jgi:choline dehydrogenase-like flavoprotein
LASLRTRRARTLFLARQQSIPCWLEDNSFSSARELSGEVEHYDGLSPAWAISYQDLGPYYAEAEKLYLVHGQTGEDPAEPPRSGPFPYPAVSHEPRIQQLADDFAKSGHRPFHLPVGIDLNESDPEAGRCIRCDRFDGFPCLADGKADAHVRCVRPALQHDNVTLLTHARADRLVTDNSGHNVTEVMVDRRGEREAYSGDIVVVSCRAVNSAALLSLQGSPFSTWPGTRSISGSRQRTCPTRRIG